MFRSPRNARKKAKLLKKMTRRAFLGTALTGAALCALGNPVSALATPTSAEKQAEADAVREKLDTWAVQLDEASDNYYTALDEHDTAVAAMNEAHGRIDAAEARIVTLQDHLGTRASTMYRNGEMSFLSVLLGAGSFEDFVSTWDVLNDLNKDDAEMVEETKTARAEAQQAHVEFSAQEAIAAEKLAEAEAVQAEAATIVAQYETEVANLEAEVAQIIAEEKAAEEAAAAAAAAAAASSSSSGSSGGSSYSSGSSIPANGSVVDYASSRLGCPYVWGATGPNTFDCSGLTSWCYAQTGVFIPRTSSGQRSGADAVLSVSAAEAGDVLWMSGHVGIYIGGGAYIHAPQPGDVVKVAYNMGMWSCALRFA
ncbi:MAG: hydrolase Nlp/P60 [Actinobacteria bacterium]|nr:hydrolase Nlp/P60 [Actinomycetota bacterium]